MLGSLAAGIWNGTRRIYYSSSIRTRLSLSFVVLFAALLVLLVLIVYSITSRMLIGRTIENTFQNIALASEKFDLTFDSVEDYAKTAITNKDIQEVLTQKQESGELASYTNSNKVYSALDSIISLRTLIDAMIIYDFNGRIFDSGKIQNVRYEFLGRYNYFKSFASMGQQLWIDTHPSNYTEKGAAHDIVTLVRGIVDAGTGRRIGVIETNIKEESIARLYSRIPLGDSGRIFVVNDKGQIVSHADAAMLNASVADQPYYAWIRAHDGGKTFAVGGRRELVVSRHYDRLGWTIVGIVPTDEILQDQRLLTDRLLLIGALFIALSALITIVLSNSITRPILKLKQTMKFVASGDLEVRAEVNSKDEIGTLTNEFNRMIRRTSLLMEDILAKQRKEEEYELALLQSQINPHFLYNTLESICGLAELNRNEEIIRVVSELAFFYRGVLSKGSKIITLREELAITESYLKMLKIRYGDKLSYTIDVGEELHRYATVKLLLQPLVENALIHGLRDKRGPGTIAIVGRADNGALRLCVVDDGVGMDAARANRAMAAAEGDEPRPGFGLASTNKRIKLYFGQSYGLQVESGAAGTTIRIELPMNEIGRDEP